jgi:uncharacterized protein YbcI
LQDADEQPKVAGADRPAPEEQLGSVEPAAGSAPVQIDQTASDSDQLASDSDQTASDSDQAASDEDQAASDREFLEGADQQARDMARAHREHATRLREKHADARLQTAASRDIAADERAQTAEMRLAGVETYDDAAESVTREVQTLRAARDREQAADDRTRAARDRARAADNRARAAGGRAGVPEAAAVNVHATPAGGEAPLAGGHLLAAISTSIVGLLREHYGRGPMKAKTYALDDVIVVVMRGSGFTALEQTIMESGEPDHVIAMREDFQRVMAARYKKTIEALTGRKVLAFLSQAHVEPDITMEIFFVDGPLDGFGAVEITQPVE